MSTFIKHQEFILNHLIYGEIKRGKSFGIHFFQENLHLIDEITKPSNELGVWEAKIKVRHPKTNNWVTKEKPSTFFPIDWSQEELIEKLERAYASQKKVTHFQYIGETTCGIKVTFFYRNKELVGCFPIYFDK